MKTNHESTTDAAVRERAYLAWVPGEPGSVATRVCGMTQALEMFKSDEDVGRLLRGFKWGVEQSRIEPVCVVETEGGPRTTDHETTEPAAVTARRELICRVTRELKVRLVTVPRAEWQATMVREGTEPVAEARQWFPTLPVTADIADGLLLLAWALTEIEKGGQ